MLFGRMPGDATPASLFAVLPSYGTLMSRYLDRLGPYRLQPYEMPAAPRYGAAAPVPAAPPPLVVPPTAPRPSRMFEVDRGGDRRSAGKAFDPVGAGPGALIGYDRAIALGEALANPMGLGFGFSNPGFVGLAGLAMREIGKATRQDAVSKINEARMKGLINDANRRVGRGTPIRRAGGVGTPGVSGNFTTMRIDPESRRAGAADRSAQAGSSNRGPGSRGRGFGHYGGPR